MLKVICEVESVTPLQFNRHIGGKKEANETNDDFEARIWQERGEYDENDELFINHRRFEKALAIGAKHLNIQIPGEGKATYTKFFTSGVIVRNNIYLGIHKGDVQGQWVFTRPRIKDGSRWVCFPQVRNWNGTLEINVLSEKVTEDIFRQVIEYAGMSIGIGSYRPENGGFLGRFEVLEIAFEKIAQS